MITKQAFIKFCFHSLFSSHQRDKNHKKKLSFLCTHTHKFIKRLSRNDFDLVGVRKLSCFFICALVEGEKKTSLLPPAIETK